MSKYKAVQLIFGGPNGWLRYGPIGLVFHLWKPFFCFYFFLSNYISLKQQPIEVKSSSWQNIFSDSSSFRPFKKLTDSTLKSKIFRCFRWTQRPTTFNFFMLRHTVVVSDALFVSCSRKPVSEFENLIFSDVLRKYTVR